MAKNMKAISVFSVVRKFQDSILVSKDHSVISGADQGWRIGGTMAEEGGTLNKYGKFTCMAINQEKHQYVLLCTVTWVYQDQWEPLCDCRGGSKMWSYIKCEHRKNYGVFIT